MNKISVKMCIYRENGMHTKNTPREIEYAHQSTLSITGVTVIHVKKCPTALVKNPPLPYKAAVAPSANKRSGKIAHNDIKANRSPGLSFVVFLMPKILLFNRLK